MFFPSPSVWKVAKDAPKYIPNNMIGYAQTSHKINKDVISLYYRRF